MARTSKALVDNTFARFLNAIGGEPATWTRIDSRNVANIGGYRLDHNSAYGGWNIEQNVNEGGGIRHPFGDMRMSSSQIVDAMNFAMDVLRETKRQ